MLNTQGKSMPKTSPRNPADYIVPLNMNGLDGRMLHLPPPKGSTSEILFVYGHHSSLERWWGVMQVLNRYTAVTMPDLPGFGGMDSFYTIGKKPTIDNMADYLAAFIKLRYKRKKIAIAGMSYGFVIVTRMLQRYPELTKKVTLLVSIVGFAHRDDFTFSNKRYKAYLFGTRLGSFPPIPTVFRHLALNKHVLRAAYARTHNAKNKFKDAKGKEEFDNLMDIEIGLWHDNDVRTWFYTTSEFLKLDNCGVKVNLPLLHITVEGDRYFDHRIVEQHLRIIFKDVEVVETKLDNHAPSVIADEKMAAPLVPPKLRRHLAKLR
jgi:pimeloyl-ACP methyl ester carboxylesterase